MALLKTGATLINMVTIEVVKCNQVGRHLCLPAFATNPRAKQEKRQIARFVV
jgi:hypothetical protein